MGSSPDIGWIQRVTIEIPGPPTSQQQWEDYKAAIDAVLATYAGSVGARIVEITNIRKPAEEEGSGSVTVTIKEP